MATSLFLSPGCSNDGQLELTGKVTLDGKPVEDGTIDFLPMDDEGPTAGT